MFKVFITTNQSDLRRISSILINLDVLDINFNTCTYLFSQFQSLNRKMLKISINCHFFMSKRKSLQNQNIITNKIEKLWLLYLWTYEHLTHKIYKMPITCAMNLGITFSSVLLFGCLIYTELILVRLFFISSEHVYT